MGDLKLPAVNLPGCTEHWVGIGDMFHDPMWLVGAAKRLELPSKTLDFFPVTMIIFSRRFQTKKTVGNLLFPLAREDHTNFYVPGKGSTVFSWKKQLVGGLKYVLFAPPISGNDPIWRAYFSNGLVQPPTRKTQGLRFSCLDYMRNQCVPFSSSKVRYLGWWQQEMLHIVVSKNRGTPKWMVYNRKPY